MESILDKIVAKTKVRVEKAKQERPIESLKDMILDLDAYCGLEFEKALQKPDISFICEVKKASPSKGIIAENFPYIQIAKEYEAAGAAAISVLTEPDFFMGCNSYLEEISRQVNIPLLRKDFTIDAYQIYEAKLLGASAVLLICSILDDDQLKEFLHLADTLGLSALVEAHDEEEVFRAIAAGAKIIGVNNRDLKTFTVDISNSIQLRKLVPQDILFISESGIKDAQDIEVLRKNQIDGVLIGETFMKSHNKKEVLDELRGFVYEG